MEVNFSGVWAAMFMVMRVLFGSFVFRMVVLAWLFAIARVQERNKGK